MLRRMTRIKKDNSHLLINPISPGAYGPPATITLARKKLTRVEVRGCWDFNYNF